MSTDKAMVTDAAFEAAARALVPFAYGAFEQHGTDACPFEPGKPNANCYNAARAFIAALAQAEQPVAVKPLEWRGTEGVWAKADALFGATYRITEYSGMAKPFKLETVGFVGPSGHYELIDEAKAAAQADYERRVLSCLSTPEQGETEAPVTQVRSVAPTIYVSRNSLDQLLNTEGSHVALQTLIHRKPLRSGNGVALYEHPTTPSPRKETE